MGRFKRGDLVVTQDRTANIIRLHDEVIGHAKQALEKAIQVGEELTEQKAALGHGQWLPWIKKNLPFSQPTAYRYMRLHEDREKLFNVNNLAEAYKLLAPPTSQETEEEETETAYNRVLANALITSQVQFRTQTSDLYSSWLGYNKQFFYNKLKPPLIIIAPMTKNLALIQLPHQPQEVSYALTIKIRESVIEGKLNAIKDYSESELDLFVDHLLLHEMVHQYLWTLEPSKEVFDHGPRFLEECNRIAGEHGVMDEITEVSECDLWPTNVFEYTFDFDAEPEVKDSGLTKPQKRQQELYDRSWAIYDFHKKATVTLQALTKEAEALPLAGVDYHKYKDACLKGDPELMEIRDTESNSPMSKMESMAHGIMWALDHLSRKVSLGDKLLKPFPVVCPIRKRPSKS